jgi:hypothetical protein
MNGSLLGASRSRSEEDSKPKQPIKNQESDKIARNSKRQWARSQSLDLKTRTEKKVTKKN